MFRSANPKHESITAKIFLRSCTIPLFVSPKIESLGAARAGCFATRGSASLARESTLAAMLFTNCHLDSRSQ
jgi:hypothetical protein